MSLDTDYGSPLYYYYALFLDSLLYIDVVRCMLLSFDL